MKAKTLGEIHMLPNVSKSLASEVLKCWQTKPYILENLFKPLKQWDCFGVILAVICGYAG